MILRRRDWRAIATNTAGNLGYWMRCQAWRAPRLAHFLKAAVRALVFVCLGATMLLLMVLSTAAFAVLRKAMWHVDENWLYALERGSGMGPLELPAADENKAPGQRATEPGGMPLERQQDRL